MVNNKVMQVINRQVVVREVANKEGRGRLGRRNGTNRMQKEAQVCKKNWARQ